MCAASLFIASIYVICIFILTFIGLFTFKPSLMKRSAILISVSVCCLLYCCKKENKNSGSRNNIDTLVYNFSYSGTPCINDTISFIANEPAGTTYLWNFGDGENASITAPYHQYVDSGSYKVTLTVNNDTSHIISKTIIIYNNPIYTNLAASTKTWHHVHLNVWSDGYIDSTVNDTTLQVTYINAVAISFLGDTLIYSPSSSSGNELVFVYNFYTSPIQNRYGSILFTFNHITDSMECSSFIHPGPGEGLEFYDYYTSH